MLIFLVLFIIIFLTFNPENNNPKSTIIKTLIKQCARWALAAEQDNSPIIAVLHANYAAGYLWAIRDIATDDEISKYGGINFMTFRDKIIAIQEKSSMRMGQLCPQFIGKNDKYLSAIAGEG